jgi:hypothetical protein
MREAVLVKVGIQVAFLFLQGGGQGVHVQVLELRDAGLLVAKLFEEGGGPGDDGRGGGKTEAVACEDAAQHDYDIMRDQPLRMKSKGLTGLLPWLGGY